MKHILYAFFALLSFVSFGQEPTANAIIYSETGEKFRVYLNGELMNEDPKANVKLNGLTSEFYQINIDFSDASMSDFNSDMFAVKYGMEVTYRIIWSKKGYVLRYFSERPMNIPQKYESTSIPQKIEPPVEIAVPETSKEVTTTHTATTTVVQQPQAADNVNMKVNMNGVKVDVNVQNNGHETSHQTTTTTTTTHTNQVHVKNTTTHTPVPVKKTENYEHSTAAHDCFLEIKEFQAAKSSIGSKSFSDSKMTLAKEVTDTHCLTALQIKDITALFDFETDRLKYATYAYDHCADKQNYYIVNDAFQFESTIDELHKNITKKK